MYINSVILTQGLYSRYSRVILICTYFYMQKKNLLIACLGLPVAYRWGKRSVLTEMLSCYFKRLWNNGITSSPRYPSLWKGRRVVSVYMCVCVLGGMIVCVWGGVYVCVCEVGWSCVCVCKGRGVRCVWHVSVCVAVRVWVYKREFQLIYQ